MADVDVVVIGAGPAGLAATLGLARSQRSVAMLDSNRPRHAATLVTHGFITRDGISPTELRRLGREDALRYPHVQHVKTIVRSVSPLADGRFVVLAERQGSAEQTEVRASAVLIATGLVEQLPIPSLVRPHYGTSLHSCMDCDAYDKRGQPLALIGETSDLVRRAEVIARHTEDLVVFTNGSGVVDAAGRARLDELGIGLDDGLIAAIDGDGGGMRGIIMTDGRRSARTGGFVRPVWQAPLGFASDLGLALDPDGLIVVDERQRTSVAGIYAAGDVTPGFRQLLVAAGHGTVAGSVINRDLIARGR